MLLQSSSLEFLERFPRGESVLSLAQIKLFSIPIIGGSLITSVDNALKSPNAGPQGPTTRAGWQPVGAPSTATALGPRGEPAPRRLLATPRQKWGRPGTGAGTHPGTRDFWSGEAGQHLEGKTLPVIVPGPLPNPLSDPR